MRTQSAFITLPNGFYAETQKTPRMKCRMAMQITEVNMEIFSNSREPLVWAVTELCYVPSSAKINKQVSKIDKKS